jgi:hypothetical protein
LRRSRAIRATGTHGSIPVPGATGALEPSRGHAWGEDRRASRQEWLVIRVNGQRRMKRCASRKAAQIPLDQIDARIKLGDDPFARAAATAALPSAYPRLRDSISAWVERQTTSGELRGSTPKNYLSRLRTWVFPHLLVGRVLGDLPVNLVSREMLGAVLLQIKAAGRSLGVIEQVRNPLRGYYAELLETKSLPAGAVNPAADLKFFVGKRAHKRKAAPARILRHRRGAPAARDGEGRVSALARVHPDRTPGRAALGRERGTASHRRLAPRPHPRGAVVLEKGHGRAAVQGQRGSLRQGKPGAAGPRCANTSTPSTWTRSRGSGVSRPSSSCSRRRPGRSTDTTRSSSTCAPQLRDVAVGGRRRSALCPGAARPRDGRADARHLRALDPLDGTRPRRMRSTGMWARHPPAPPRHLWQKLRGNYSEVLMVEGKGFEPSTSALRTPRSPN